MSEPNSSRFDVAEYRVRLFLSVDLSGSTAFKNSKDGEERKSGATPSWVTVFREFYSDFPSRFAAEFHQERTASVGRDKCPELWKAIGDELVFCGRVSNKKSCAVAIDTFVNTLYNYRKLLSNKGIDLNLKGAGWLAAFPEPNRTVQLRVPDGSPELLPASEALEASADDNPFEFDFLGKAIDTGFRMASRAQPDKFALSVQLARLLASGGASLRFGHQVRLGAPSTLKGVNKNEPYPFLYFDTMEHLATQTSRQLEREVLKENDPPDQKKLSDYLEAYCAVVGTDEIMLKEDDTCAEVEKPESYARHKDQISKHLSGERHREANDESQEDQEEANDVNLEAAQALEPISDKKDPEP